MIKAWDKCPLRYKKEYIDKESTHYQPEVNTGIRLHEAMHKHIIGNIDSIPELLKSDEDKILFEKIEQSIDFLFVNDLVYPIKNPEILSEFKFQTEIEEIKLKGTMDIILVGKKEVRIIDLKTGWGRSSQNWIQATLYTKAAEKIWDPWKVSFAFWHPRWNGVEETIDMLNWEKLKEIIKTMSEDTKFVATPSYATCRYCPYGDTCKSRRRKHGKGFSCKEAGIAC